eukprot:17643-Heterococcus_DN1.PRE.2
MQCYCFRQRTIVRQELPLCAAAELRQCAIAHSTVRDSLQTLDMCKSSGHSSSSNEQLHRVTEAAAVTHTKVSPMTVTLA